jgi:hypothetical protein
VGIQRQCQDTSPEATTILARTEAFPTRLGMSACGEPQTGGPAGPGRDPSPSSREKSRSPELRLQQDAEVQEVPALGYLSFPCLPHAR